MAEVDASDTDGAVRIEICSRLALGGLRPSIAAPSSAI